MKSVEYRAIIAKIVHNVLKKHYPGLKRVKCNQVDTACWEIAKVVHARMYGANVDGVDSPIWRDMPCYDKQLSAPPNLPNVDASQLLRENK